MHRESLTKQHLARPQHTAPSNVTGELSARQTGKVLSVGEPEPAGKISFELLHSGYACKLNSSFVCFSFCNFTNWM